MPGTDPDQACRVVFDELPELPFLPELPGRGPGADLIGRTAALLVDMPVQTTSQGWKLADRPGRDLSRAAGYWSHDLDTLEQVAEGYQGALKIAVCGPWTLAATLELSHSVNPALTDPGAIGYLAGSLAQGLADHAADVRRRVPGATLIVQLDSRHCPPRWPAGCGRPADCPSSVPLTRPLPASAWKRCCPRRRPRPWSIAAPRGCPSESSRGRAHRPSVSI